MARNRHKILVVDDDWLTRHQTESMLTDLGYQVVGQAETGAEAVDMARDLKLDLILMDVMMPGDLNGIEAARKIKAESNTPVVFISGYGDPEIIDEAKKIEPFGYIMKPFDRAELQAFVEIALFKSKMERRLEEKNRQLRQMNMSLINEVIRRNRAEEAVRQSHKALSNSQRIARLGSWELDLNTRIITLSEEHQLMLGREATATELPFDEFILDYVTKSDISIIKKCLDTALENIENPDYHDSFECRLKAGDAGGHKILAFETRFMKKGVVTGVAQDITERKKAAEALRQSEEKYRTILDSIGDGYFETDIAGNITFFNESFSQILGHSHDELKGSNYKDMMDRETAKNIHRLFYKVYKTGKPVKGIQSTVFRKDDREIDAEVSASLMKDATEKRTGFRGIVRDVSEKSRVERAKEKLEEQLHRAQKMAALGTLVAGVAHEINNPNNFIAINAPILGQAWQSILPVLEDHYAHHGDFSVAGLPFTMMRERAPQLFDGILDGSGRIKRIVSDLKSFARPESQVSYEPVDINSAVKSALTLISNLIKKSTNRFSVEYGHNIPNIKGDYHRLEQVVINLVQNACQALSDKNQEIRVATAYRKRDETILIKVQDQGMGIASESLPRIMDPFFTTKRDAGGTGLGLSVSFSIIEKHRGDMTVHSDPGRGTTFTVALPAKGKRDRLKVLVADDDDMVRRTIVDMLEEEGAYSIMEASNGMDACIKLGSFRPDLLILDIQMPDMSGVEVAKKVKSDPEFSHTKVVVVTGFWEGEDARKISEMGFTSFCAKPFRIKDFMAVIQHVLNGGSEAPEANRFAPGVR